MNKKNILLIAYSYPPYQDPQSIRWFRFSNLLAEKGYKIDVVTIKRPSNMYKNNIFKFHNNITIFKLFPGPAEEIINRIRTKINADTRYGFSQRQTKPFKFLKASYWFFMNNILLGDLRTEWFPFCVNFLKNINLDKYSALITSQEPFVDSLIGLKIKKIKPNIFWIADMGDIAMSPYRPQLKQRADMFFEKAVMKKSNIIVLTNKKALDIVSSKYDINKNKFFIITQGFSLKEFYNKENNINKTFTLLFTGTFYKGFREPDNLIKAIADLNIDIKLLIAGKNESFTNKFAPIKNKSEFLGFVPYFESLKLQNHADILINIANKQEYQIPGKFFEYLGSKKPILNIVYDVEEETSKLVKKLQIGVVCKNNVNDIKHSILQLYNIWKSNTINDYFNFNNEEIKAYSWEKGAEQFNKILEMTYKTLKSRY